MIQNGVLLMEKSLAHNSGCRRDMLCGTDGSPTSHQTVPRLLPAWHEVGVLFQTHFVTFLPENLSSYEKKASVNRSMPMKRTVHDVTTAYVAETAAGVLRAGIKDCPEISTGCEQIAPEHLRDMNRFLATFGDAIRMATGTRRIEEFSLSNNVVSPS